MATGLKGSPDIGFLLVGGRDVRSRTTVFNETEEAVLEETSAFGDNTDNWDPVGQSTWELSQEGFYDTVVGGMNEALAALSTAAPLMYAIAGNTIGDDFLGLDAIRSTYDKVPAKGKLHRAKAVYKANAAPRRGQIAADWSTRTLAGPTSTTFLDMGAAYAAQNVGSLHAFLGVSALTLGGATGLQVKVKHCATSGGSYVDLITFTTVTTAPNAEHKSVLGASGQIERYIQIQWQFLGSPSGQTCKFAVGIARPLT